MTKLKRLVTLMLTLVTLLSTLPATALATDADADVPAEETVAVEEETADDEVASVEEETTTDEVATVEEETVAEEVASVEEETVVDEVAAVQEETADDEVAAVGEETNTGTDFSVHVNPLYEDVIDADDIDLEAAKANLETAVASAYEANYLSYDEAVKVIRSYLTARTTSFTIYFYSSSTPDDDYSVSLVDDAMAHTGLSTQGDALLWDYGSYSCSRSWSSSGGAYYATLVYDIQYYTTAAQESWLKSKITSIVSSLDLAGKSDYEKIRAVYGYICDNVEYDDEHLQYTAYAALHDGAAVCQGYAVLFYRMALEAGIDARVIVGRSTVNGELHAWNIAQLGSYYYNLDPTWDAGETEDTYWYFLRASGWFFDTTHVRWGLYDNSSFHSQYPMASSDYVYNLPLTPTLKSISNTTSGVTVTWEAVDGATSYKVYRKVSGSSSWSLVGTSTTTSYTSTGVESGKTYTFTVRAVNSSGTSGYSATGLTIRYLATPKITLSNTSSGVKVAWGSISGASSYYVYRKTESGSYSKIATVASGTLNYTDTSASAGVRYYYAVRAYSGGYLSAYTSQYITRLTTPSGISVSNIKSGVQVKWNAVTGATSYQVWRKTPGGSWARVGSTSDTTYISTGVSSGNTYIFTVKAAYGSSVSAYNTTGKTIMRLAEPTITLENLVGGLTASWNSVAGAEGYKLYRRSETGSYVLVATLDADTLSYTDKAAGAGIVFYYRVQAYNGSYTSSWTSQFTRRIGHTTLTLSQGEDGVVLEWTESKGCTGFYIYRMNEDGSYTRIKTISSSDIRTWTDTDVDLTPGNSYTYYIRGYNGSSLGSYTPKTILIKA